MELTANSIRANADYSRHAGASLIPGALLTLVSPDHYGAPGVEHYTGPPDITQFYLYMGFCACRWALAGLLRCASAGLGWFWRAGMWYAFGPPGGLYSLIGLLPGFHNVRAPDSDVVRRPRWAGFAGGCRSGSDARPSAVAVDRGWRFSR